MNYRPAGFDDFSDDDEEASECESGFSENSDEEAAAAPPPVPERLQTAILHGAADEVATLVAELGADYEGCELPNGLRPLVYAASLGQAPLVDWLLRHDAESGLAADTYAAYTPLMAACSGFADGGDQELEAERLRCVQLLLAGGHEADFRDRYGETALMRACKCAPLAAVETLLQLGKARLNEADNDGWSPLFYATSRGDLPLVEFLLTAGAEATRPDKRNRLPYMVAMEKGFTELADLLTPDTERPPDEFALVPARPSIFDAEADGRFCTEVLEMVMATSATMKRNAAVFANRRLSLREFLLLRTEHELKALGVLFSGHRKKILARVKQFHLGIWAPASFGLAERPGCGRLLAMLDFVATLHRQLYVLRVSLEYVAPDVAQLGAQEGEAAAQMLRAAKKDLLQLNERMAAMRGQLATINAESRPYLTAEEIAD